MSLATLFPDSDFRHQLSVKRGSVADFFAPTAAHESILAERKRWLADSPESYFGALDSTGEIIDEAAALITPTAVWSASGDPIQKMIELGGAAEPDIVLLQKSADGTFRVVAGAVCFPSSWSFPEKMGMPLHDVHSVVPDLNAAIGPPIARFLDKMQPGIAWERSNWGLSASPERNQHPSRAIERLREPLSPEQVWLRAEEQILVVLPETKALLFAIRIVAPSLQELREENPQLAAGLRRALETMSEEMARYKHFAGVRPQLIDLLA